MFDPIRQRVEVVVDDGIRGLRIRPDQRIFYISECDSLEKLAQLEESIARAGAFSLTDAEVRLCRARNISFADYRRALVECLGFTPYLGGPS